MPRTMWKGAISFGLVHIPVEMVPAVSDHGLDLSMLDRRDFAPIGFKRYNKNTGKEVAWDDIVKGYEYSDGEYVVLSDEDLRRANPEATQTIDILAFVNADQVPLIYYEQPYYLSPGKGGDKVYALLREALREVGKIGIANVVIRVKQHLAALVCVGDTIVLNTLRYPDEIRPTDELRIPGQDSKASRLTEKELQMAKALVEGMSEKWKPQQYHDSYREDLMALVKKKIEANQTKTLTAPEPEEAKPAKADVIDLVALLQASLGKKPSRAAPDDDGDDDPPPRRSRKPDADENEEDDGDAPPPRARKQASASGAHANAVPAKRAAAKTVASKTVAKKSVTTKGAVAKNAPAKRAAGAGTASTSKTAAADKAPARRRKAA
ncbi:Ku protein [Massilia forsythiae]|uniref:Non-homologous end joining protein Ku n=1 Tax=Massilia forsythiae TaxID=2728020 RepID=A0A7Z2ZUM7_9BURK|nr:Ku protein [Massilia forsythiae]QJE02713.1 Ku protein [Massilia forsythiae]